MNIWKVCFFFAVCLWGITLWFVLWNHHVDLNYGVEWSNAHLFAKAPRLTATQRLDNAIKHRPVLDPHLLENTGNQPQVVRSGKSDSANQLPSSSASFNREQNSGAPTGHFQSGHHSDAVASRQHAPEEPSLQDSPKASRSRSVPSHPVAPSHENQSVPRKVARSGCHHLVGGCAECNAHYDGRPDFEGEDCVPVIAASITDNICEPLRFVVEEGLERDTECAHEHALSGSGSHVQSGNNEAAEVANGDVSPTYLATLTGAAFPLQHSLANSRSLSSKARNMCKTTYEHTLKTTTKILPDGGTFVFTGDLDDLWLRDSAAQVHPYLNYVAEDPQMRRLVEGLVKRHAFYVLFDPYANAFRIDTSYKFSEKQMSIGRHDYISTWDYELDSGCYFLRLVYSLWQAVPNSPAVADEQTHKAASLMVDVWTAEQRHEEDPPMVGVHESDDKRFKKIGKPYRMPLTWPPKCHDCAALDRKGKGPPSAYTGMTWSAFRPSDDACTYSYLVPANMFASVALGYVRELATKVWNDPALAQRATKLQQEIDNGIREHAIVDHPTYGQIYAYEVDGLGNHNLMDDANVPNLMSIPYLGWDYDPEIYANTRAFVLSKSNPT